MLLPCTVQITFIFIGQTRLVFGKCVCTCCNDSHGVRPGISGHQISREATDRDSRSVGVQTNYFLMLHYLEREPDVLTETFLRVDRDKILNSSLLPEIIPTVYQRRVIMKTDSEESLNACITGSKSCTITKHSNAFRTFLNWLKNSKRVWHEPKLHISRLPLFANFDL